VVQRQAQRKEIKGKVAAEAESQKLNLKENK